MQQVDEGNGRRDPAPSRWAYRMHRLWLTPYVRRLTRVGLPVVVAVAANVWVFSQPQNRTAFAEMFAEIRRTFAERPEFMVQLMAIDGASPELMDDIREVLPVDFPISSFDLDLVAMQDLVEDLDAVATVDVRIRKGGVLQVDLTERVPAVVWRSGDLIEALDATGRRVTALGTRSERADLPLIAGPGADAVVPEALALLAAAEPVAERMRGLVRVGERRWDVVLDRDQRILLPEEDPVPALEQVIALHEAQELLARDLALVDMRNPVRPTLRMLPQAVEEMHRIKGIEMGNILP